MYPNYVRFSYFVFSILQRKLIPIILTLAYMGAVFVILMVTNVVAPLYMDSKAPDVKE
jgi:hypothetical protein